MTDSPLEAFFAPLLALVTVGMAFYLFYIIIHGDMNQENRDITLYLLGVLSGLLSTILNYYFGSSHSSSKKTELMGDVEEKKKSGGPPPIK